MGDIDHPEFGVLYKYMASQQRALEILRTRKLWYSRPESFNDPFDCDIDIASAVTWEQYEGAMRAEGEAAGVPRAEIEERIRRESMRCRQTVPQDYRDQVRSGVVAVQGALRSQGVLSLSAICDSVPMWGYYAACHSGVCIGFQRTAGNVLGSSATRRIQYTDALPAVSYYDLIRNPGHLSTTVMTTKARSWEHEAEWRVIVTKGDILHDLPGEIDCVLFGLRTPDSFKREVAEAVAGEGAIALRQAARIPGHFKIEFTDYR